MGSLPRAPQLRPQLRPTNILKIPGMVSLKMIQGYIFTISRVSIWVLLDLAYTFGDLK